MPALQLPLALRDRCRPPPPVRDWPRSERAPPPPTLRLFARSVMVMLAGEAKVGCGMHSAGVAMRWQLAQRANAA